MVIRDELYEQGIAQRREMFGDAGADAQVDHTTALNDKLQDFVTRNCFGDIWQRPGLSLTDRSKVTFAMLVASGKSHEMRIHAQGAIANGVSPVELREIAIHSLLYCGIPASVEAHRALEEVFTNLGVELDDDAAVAPPAAAGRSAAAKKTTVAKKTTAAAKKTTATRGRTTSRSTAASKTRKK